MLKHILATAALLLSAGCTTSYESAQDPTHAVGSVNTLVADPYAAPATPRVDASAELSTSAGQLAQSTALENEAREAQPVLYRGSNRQVRMPAVEEPVKFVGEDVSINFEQAPLSEVMHAILGDILKLDYVVDQPVKGEVTLRTRSPIPRDELFVILESLLIANDVVMVRSSDGRYLVTGAQQGPKLTQGVSNPRTRNAGFSTVIVPLQYISASSMAEILQPVADPEAFVRIDNARGRFAFGVEG